MSEDLRSKIIEQEGANSQQHDKKIKENENNIQKCKESHHHTILKDFEIICLMNSDGQTK